jgi:hypothetical protein
MAKDETISDHISATSTYMMWCEEHLWNVSEHVCSLVTYLWFHMQEVYSTVFSNHKLIPTSFNLMRNG